MPEVPPPEKFEQMSKPPALFETPEFIRRYAIELRPVKIGRSFGQKIDDGRIHIWTKIAAKLSDDPVLHLCALAYASDCSLLDAAMARHGRAQCDKWMMLVRLDHTMWFHRQCVSMTGCFTRTIRRVRSEDAVSRAD